MKIKKGDEIQMSCGKDRSKRGKVLRILPKSGKVVIEGLNLLKKNQKPKKQGEKGQRIEIPAAVNISNVKLVCPSCNKATRISFKKEGKNKIRICKKCQKEI